MVFKSTLWDVIYNDENQFKSSVELDGFLRCCVITQGSEISP